MKAAVIRGPADIRLETVETPSIRDNEIPEQGSYDAASV
jgi:hypothetical protein